MNPFMNEDVMWQRLKDIQLEAENRRLYGTRTFPTLIALVRILGRRAWRLAGLATPRAQRRPPVHLAEAECEDASDAAYVQVPRFCTSCTKRTCEIRAKGRIG